MRETVRQPDGSLVETHTYVRVDARMWINDQSLATFLGTAGYGPLGWTSHDQVYTFATLEDARRTAERYVLSSRQRITDVTFTEVTRKSVTTYERRVLEPA